MTVLPKGPSATEMHAGTLEPVKTCEHEYVVYEYIVYRARVSEIVFRCKWCKEYR